MESGLVPEFAVTAILASLLSASPKGCGATTKEVPAGVMYLPFGITVVPSLLIEQNSEPAGGFAIHASCLFLQPDNKIINKK
ncbi:MAG: hypothetical protein KAT38_11430, partial [Bacteroidales bacterium]|nr:hypothetical protein [Bacteroidales bacterium]